VDLSSDWTVCFPPQDRRLAPTVTTGIQGGTCQRRDVGSWRLPDPRTGAPPVVEATAGTYSRPFDRVQTGRDLQWLLSLGEVAETSRVSLNGTNLGDRIWPPYVFDVTRHLHAHNELRVLVQSTMLVTQVAGIAGPAALVPLKQVSIRVALPSP
jgi:hypothetical protein